MGGRGSKTPEFVNTQKQQYNGTKSEAPEVRDKGTAENKWRASQMKETGRAGGGRGFGSSGVNTFSFFFLKMIMHLKPRKRRG